MTTITTALIQKVVNSLAGRGVMVRRREPYLSGSAGSAYLTKSGQAIVDIRPGLQGAELLRVICHECAHIRAGDVAPGDYHLLPPGAISARVGPALFVKHKKIETEADSLAADWLAWRFSLLRS